MKLLPGPGKPETKNTIVHSDQRLFNKERTDKINPHPISGTSRSSGAHRYLEAQQWGSPPRLSSQLSGVAGTFQGQLALLLARLLAKSGPHYSLEDLHVLLATPSTSLQGRPVRSELSSPTMGDTSNSLRRRAAVLSALGTWGQVAETIFLHQASPWR